MDTDILIDYLRNRPEAVVYVESLQGEMLISAITAAELYAGVREGAERIKLDEFINAFTVIPIEDEIARKGGLYRRDYGKSHGTDLNDGLIAATTEIHQATLVTLNKKHFPMLTTIIVPYQKP